MIRFRRIGGAWPAARDFWLLWLVGSMMSAARFMEAVVFGVFVYRLDGSAFLVALVTMLRLLPMGLFGAFFGVFTDRIERRLGLLLILWATLATVLVLAALAYAGKLEVWHLAVASFTGGIAWATDNPLRRMMIGEVVGADALNMAMALDFGSNNVSRIVGPVIGGFMLGSVGIYGAFLGGALLYLVALFAAWSIRYRSIPIPHGSEKSLSRLIDGLKISVTNNKLKTILAMSLIASLFGWPYSSMIPVIGQDHLGLDARGIGVLASMEGLGALFAAVCIGNYCKSQYNGVIFVTMTVIYQIASVAFALAPDAVSAGVMVFAAGMGNAGHGIMQTTLIYASVAPSMRGRMLGVMSACNGTGVIGFLFVGFLAEAIGARAAVAMTGGLGLLGLVLTVQWWRTLRE